MLFGQVDWNGDGVIDSRDDALELQMLMFMQDEMEREERERKEKERERRLEAMLRDIKASPSKTVETDEFARIARNNGYWLSDFTSEDIDELNSRLEEESRYSTRGDDDDSFSFW